MLHSTRDKIVREKSSKPPDEKKSTFGDTMRRQSDRYGIYGHPLGKAVRPKMTEDIL